MSELEPNSNRAACIHCGDAPVPHRFFFYSGLIASKVDDHILKINRLAPDFATDLVDEVFYLLVEILLFFRVLKLSDDITLAKTFRSRVIWEEAEKRGIEMKQLMLLGKPSDEYMARIGKKKIYFSSLPIPSRMMRMTKSWDDKYILKKELSKKNIPVPEYEQFSVFTKNAEEKVFSKLPKPLIVKPRNGSRGRHTTTNIHTKEDFAEAVKVAGTISPYLVAEEHLEGYVCRATLVKGKIAGFYRGGAPFVIGDGVKTISELIAEKNIERNERVKEIAINDEIEKYVSRSGFKINDVLPYGKRLRLTHRTGRFFGGVTAEMLDDLHPSFIPVLEEAAQVVGLPVIGFDCIIPEPKDSADAQRWGIIECNTLPFIDLHYYALEGKPQNIAGMIWDFWN